MHALTAIDELRGRESFPPIAHVRPTPGDSRIRDAIKLIRKVGGNRIGFVGLACKTCADGLRESPILNVMTALAEEGLKVMAFDPAIRAETRLHDPLSRRWSFYSPLDRQLPGLPNTLCASAEDVIDGCETLVVTYHTRDLQALIAARQGRFYLIDLVDLFAEQPRTSTRTERLTCCRRSQKPH